MKKITAITLLVIIISFIIGIYYYQIFPEKIETHWNSGGQADGSMGRFLGLFLVPLMSLGFFLLFFLIPRIDPLKKNIEKFRNYYDWFVLILILYMSYIFLLIIFWNLGYKFNMTKLIIPSIAILFVYIGFIMNKLKKNWFMGIRTPWTLSNDKVWEKTHELGGKLFKIAGGVIFVGIFFEDYLIWFILVPALSAAIIPFIYSYFEYKKIKK